jgi:hypothetical protein
MAYRFVTRSVLEEQLAAVVSDPSAASALRAWIREMVIGDDVEFDNKCESVILAAVEKLDLASSSDSDLIETARQLHALLREIKDEDLVKALIYLASARAEITNVLRKSVEGVISPTGWLSYIAQQHWPARLKEALKQLDGPRRRQLLTGLVNADYQRVAMVLDITL